jgi:hypothetical protein
MLFFPGVRVTAACREVTVVRKDQLASLFARRYCIPAGGKNE